MQDLLNSYLQSAKKRQRDVETNKPDTFQSEPDEQRRKRTGDTGDLRDSGVPHFLILGAQKAGTMAVVKNMNKHPDINVISEVHYFDLKYHTRDPRWYRSLFGLSSKRIQGEKTPELIYVDECAVRIKEVCPNAKFILFLRDPIKRAFSGWNMNISRHSESLPFEECVDRNLANLNEYRSFGTAEFHYVQRGFYMDQIERFMKIFPNRDNLLVLIAERVKRNPAESYQTIFSFLGAREFSFEAEDEHVGKYSSSLSPKVIEKLRKVYHPHNERLFQWLGYRIPEWDYPEPTSLSQAIIPPHQERVHADADDTKKDG